MEKNQRESGAQINGLTQPKAVREIVDRVQTFSTQDYERTPADLKEVVSLDPRFEESLRGRIKVWLKKYESELGVLNGANWPVSNEEETILCRDRVYFKLERLRDAYVDFSLLEEMGFRSFTEEMTNVREALLKGVSRREFKIDRLLGKGTFGEVHLATLNGKQVALKTPRHLQRPDALIIEATTSMKFRHENIVSALCLCKGDNNEISFVMEYAEDGSLYDLLQSEHPKLTHEEILMYARDVASGLAYLHKRRVIHRDLKSANILLFNNKARAKISDFGQSRVLNEESVAKTVTGTFGFIAPEVLAEKDYNNKADIYSFGVLVLQMITHKVMPVIPEEARVTEISNGIENQEWKQLITDCCKTDPQKRPTSQECLARITNMLEAHQKALRQAEARQQCHIAFKLFLGPWQDLNADLKRHIVSMFLNLKYEGRVPLDTNKLLPAEFAFREEFIDIAKEIVAKYPTDEEKRRQAEFAPLYIQERLVIPAHILMEKNLSTVRSINVIMVGDDNVGRKVFAQLFCQSTEKHFEEFSCCGANGSRVILTNMSFDGQVPRKTFVDNTRAISLRLNGPIQIMLCCMRGSEMGPFASLIDSASNVMQVMVVQLTTNSKEKDLKNLERMKYSLKGSKVSSVHTVLAEGDNIDYHSCGMHDLATAMAAELVKWKQKHADLMKLFKENPSAYYKILEEKAAKQSGCVVS